MRAPARSAPVEHHYTATEVLRHGGSATLYRALHAGDGRSVVLKVIDPRHCGDRDLERLRREYETGASLDIRAVMRPLALETFQDMPALVLEDFGGQPLDCLLGTPMSAENFLDLAVPIAAALADLHQQGVVHRDIKPESILVHPISREVKLTDLGIASRLPRERQSARTPKLIEGSLPYMSPEQTGRMNRAVDSRSDLYSLGVTFYWMLTGRLPLEASDPLEWVHCHVARAPAPLSQLVPEIPEALERIVMRLLAKMADDRYHTARGVQHDLARCAAQWRSQGTIDAFSLGERDVPDRLQLPQRLYGRAAEVAALLGAFERVAGTGAPELVLVSGYSGIGKSALVHEIEKPIVGRHGLFAWGKFDQLRRDVPYSTFIHAFQELALDVLAQGEAQVSAWSERLRAALGANAGVLLDVIPQLEHVLGPQPPVPDLPPEEARNRFRTVFRSFIGAFARRDHPLTLFLDDVQGSDPASLELLRDLATHPEIRFLLVIAAYRDNAVGPAHPLTLALEAARKGGARVLEIALGPLSDEHLATFLADALHVGREQVAPLAQLVRERTSANPYFTIQFLTALYREGRIRFDGSFGAWRWDVEEIRAQTYTDNVVELMSRKLRRLPAGTQEAMKIAACIGSSVDAPTLSLVLQRDVEGALRPAVEDELLLQVEHAYRFPHDRVHEAAYSLVREDERAAAHLEIGRALLARMAPADVEERVFEIVNQLNRGAALIASREERERLAELDLAAARRARRSAAYDTALRYFATGAALLSEDRWERLYELAFALELHRAECEYLTGALEVADERLSKLSRHARDLVDAAAVACAQMALYTTMDRSDRAVEACLEYLLRLGIGWSPHPTSEEVVAEYERVWRQIGTRSIEELIHLPAMADPERHATLEVLTSGLSPALFTDENLHCLLVCRMVNLSLEHGNGDGSCLAFLRLGMILGPRFGDYRVGYRFGKLGLELLEKRRLLRFRARAYVGFGHLVNPWTRHFREGIGLVRRAFEVAQETGDLTYASYAKNCLVTLLLASAEPLPDVLREAERALAFARQARFGLVADILASQLQLVRVLRGLTPHFGPFDEPGFDERSFEQHLGGDPRLAIASCWYWIRKLQMRFLAGDHGSALEAAARAQPLLWTSPSFFEVAEYHFYRALALAARCDMAGPEERGRCREAMREHLDQLEQWAGSCPENFADRAALAGAESARVNGEPERAASLYEQAIRSARDNGFVQNEGLAYELASRSYRARRFDLFADTYLREARACYLRWGADGKVREIERLHPGLVEPRALAPGATFAARAEQLDLLSVVKASQTISGEIEAEKLVGTLLRVVLEAGGASRAYLLLARGGALSVEAEATLEGKEVVTRLLPSLPVEPSSLLPGSVAQYARLTREPVILEDAIAGGGRFASDPYFAQHRTRSILCLPILRQESLVGLLHLENELVAGAFTPDRLTALSLLSAQAAISMENARLLLEERRARQRSAFLSEAGALLSGSLDYEETLSRLGRLCVESLADTCVLDLIEGREIRGVARACADPAKEPLLEQLRQRYPARWDSPHAAAICLRSGEPILIPEITDDFLRGHCEDEGHMELVRAIGTRSAVVVPLVARGQTLGVFTLGSVTARRYGQTDLELAQEVARRAASAIDNARVHREVQRADRCKGEFIAVLSHELRNPLAPIRAAVHVLERAPPGGEQAVLARKIIARQAEHLAHLVDDLLDVTRISHGKVELQRARVDLGVVVRSTCEDLRPLFERGDVELRLEPPLAPICVHADATRLSQVVGNLLQNAIKFTPAGGNVAVSVTAVGGRAAISIRDTGVGMAPGEVERMFEPFVQAEQGLSRAQGGLGLGLALAKGLIELHGGSIHARSEGPGRGSEFVVSLPLAT